ncbi:hypothetical protein [Phenylobacterium sp.]|uniref:hypothetical protein n=1 Tax=Phenylobacterium sp. TaxID=1871053 RepID=UPI001229B925|nr:hypothetical protein [Phenylobacterium sp.]THD71706.1 MAG: hypothetical protein E8A12_01455 [Phenylobacterium sp.]
MIVDLSSAQDDHVCGPQSERAIERLQALDQGLCVARRGRETRGLVPKLVPRDHNPAAPLAVQQDIAKDAAEWIAAAVKRCADDRRQPRNCRRPGAGKLKDPAQQGPQIQQRF